MHIKFLARGTGSAAASAAYLLADRDAAGTRRARVEVLRGDPHEVAAVADGLPFKHRYTSGVIAWSPEDNPTMAAIERVVDEFEETAWAGLDRDRYVWSAVLHRDHDGGVHLHIFAARCDLTTGRSLNIAPPGWQKTFDPLRDAFNHEHGWSRPDDPARARPYRPAPYGAYLDAETLRAGWEVEPNPRELIGQHLMARVSVGTVTDRAGVVGALEELGLEVTRQGEHYVTARHPESGDRWRLKGTLYERDFDRERFVRQQAPEPSRDRERADRGDDAVRAAEAAWKDLEEKRLQRAEYHQARYGRGNREGRARARGARDAAGDVERESGPAATAPVGHEAGPESLAEHLRRELGDDAVVADGDSSVERDRELEAIRGAVAGDATACLAVLARVSVVHDRDRASADSGLASVVRAVRAGAEAAGRADRGLAAADRGLAAADRGLAAAGRAARGCGDALDRGIRDAGPDLWRAVSKRVAGREQAVCATSKGEQWLVEAQQTVLEGADRPLTWAGRVRAVETVEGRLHADLAGREESLAATSAGSVLLQEVYGEGGAAAAPLQRDAEGVAETLAEWESRVRGAEERVGEELDRLEKELVAIVTIADLPASAGALVGDGRTLSFVERWEAYERAKSGFEEELDREEAAIREDPAGEEFLRDARLEVLGGAGRETATLERARIVKAAAEAKRQAEEKWNEEKAARVEALGRVLGGTQLLHAHLADRDPGWDRNRSTTTTRENITSALDATENDAPRLERLRGVLSDDVAASRYREELDQVSGQFKTSDLDRALAAAERTRIEARHRRVDQLEAGLPAEVVAASTGFANVDPAAPLARSGYTLEDLAGETERRRVEAAQQARIEARRGRVEELETGLPAEAVAASTGFANVDPAAPLARSGYTLEDLAGETERRRVEAAQQARIEARRGRVEELETGLPAEAVAASTGFANVDPAAPLARSGYTLEDLAGETERRRVEAAQQARIEARRGRVEELETGLPAEAVAASTGFANVDPAAPLARSGYTLEDLAGETERRRVEAAQQARIEARRGHVEELTAGLPAEVVAASTGFANVDPAAPLARSGYTLEDLAGETERRRVEAAQQARIEARRGHVEELTAGLPAEVVAASTGFANVDPAAPLARSGYTLEDLAGETERRRVEAAQHEADAGEKDESSEDLPVGWHQLPEVVQVRLVVHAVETKLPRRDLYPGNPSHRPPAVSDKLLDHLAAATADEFVTKAIAEVQKSQRYYSNLARTNSEKDHLRATTERKHQDNLDAYKKAEANRRYFSRRPRQPTWAAAQHVVIKEYETKLLGVITAVCRDVQQWSPARIQLELQRLDALAPHQVPTHGRGENSPVRGGCEPATKRLTSGAGARKKQDKSPTKD